MQVLAILSFVITVLGTYKWFSDLKLLLPCYFIPRVRAQLNETRERLHDAETTNAIPYGSRYRDRLVGSYTQFIALAGRSIQSRQFFQQIRLASLEGLTYKLYVISSEIEALQEELEVAMDARQLAAL